MYLDVMNRHSRVLIIGGGLAGLVSAIHLAQQKVQVLLIEKDTYPRHKVCGEYISNEIVPYFKDLGLELDHLHPVDISKFVISTQKGNLIHSQLPLGGFGISRYALDHYLWQKAERLGVILVTDIVTNVQFTKHQFEVVTQRGAFTADFVIGAYGKRSSLDSTLNRKWSTNKSSWLAVKMHYKASFDPQTVALHNFDGGYCGLSMVENETVNACYLTSYQSFKKYRDVEAFQGNVLNKNPYLRAFFAEARPAFEKPITIAQVNFAKKKPVEQHIFMAGDAAGLIHPLCGNGMAMAIQSARILTELLIKSDQKLSYSARLLLEKQYEQQWQSLFSRRLYMGRVLQRVLLNPNLQQVSYRIASAIPSIVPQIIKQTHGSPIIC